MTCIYFFKLLQDLEEAKSLVLNSVASRGGGSDAFSGITGNPLVGEVSKLLLTRGTARSLDSLAPLILVQSKVYTEMLNCFVALCSSEKINQIFAERNYLFCTPIGRLLSAED